MNIVIQLPQRTIVLPLIYDLKITLLEVNEEKGKVASKEWRRKDAVHAFTQNLKLFYQGESVMGEGLQYLATLARLQELGVQTEIHPFKRWWGGFTKMIWKYFKSSGPIIELDEQQWHWVLDELLRLQEIALQNVEPDVNNPRRVNEIASLFRRLESF